MIKLQIMRLREKIKGVHKLLLIVFFSLYFIQFSVLLLGCSLKYVGPKIVKGGVRFLVKSPQANRVTIVGSFNHWNTDKDALSGPDDDGIWSIIIPLTDGRYEYLFLINNEKWLLDPAVPSIDDGLGGKNSVILIKR